jgi:putative component of toxin-antitoxin plasmid stabilization module
MAKFEFREIDALTGSSFKVMQLNIDGVNQLDEFESALEENHKSQYNTLLAFIDRYTQTGRIPGDKFKEITPKGALRKEFEFRTKNGIRLYSAQASNGIVVILCGMKGNQKQDIPRFRQLIKRVFS